MPLEVIQDALFQDGIDRHGAGSLAFGVHEQHTPILDLVRGQGLRFAPTSPRSQADRRDHGDVGRPAALVDSLEQLVDLVIVQIGQLAFLQAQRAYPGKWIRVVDLFQLEQHVEHRTQVGESVVQRLRIRSLLEHRGTVLGVIFARHPHCNRVAQVLGHGVEQSSARFPVRQRMGVQQGPAVDQLQEPACVPRAR
ncbi:hypothetical protein D9M68_528630 [compost metagenome]